MEEMVNPFPGPNFRRAYSGTGLADQKHHVEVERRIRGHPWFVHLARAMGQCTSKGREGTRLRALFAGHDIHVRENAILVTRTAALVWDRPGQPGVREYSLRAWRPQ
jgi:hypothetical protein